MNLRERFETSICFFRWNLEVKPAHVPFIQLKTKLLPTAQIPLWEVNWRGQLITFSQVKQWQGASKGIRPLMMWQARIACNICGNICGPRKRRNSSWLPFSSNKHKLREDTSLKGETVFIIWVIRAGSLWFSNTSQTEIPIGKHTWQCKTPNWMGFHSWENHRTKYWIFQQDMFDYRR